MGKRGITENNQKTKLRKQKTKSTNRHKKTQRIETIYKVYTKVQVDAGIMNWTKDIDQQELIMTADARLAKQVFTIHLFGKLTSQLSQNYLKIKQALMKQFDSSGEIQYERQRKSGATYIRNPIDILVLKKITLETRFLWGPPDKRLLCSEDQDEGTEWEQEQSEEQ